MTAVLDGAADAVADLARYWSTLSVEDQSRVWPTLSESSRRLIQQACAAYSETEADRYFPSAREKQSIPLDMDWLIWLIMAGRGFGKTVTGSEWIVEEGTNNPATFAIVAPTFAAGRDICIEGVGDDGKPSGVLSVLERRGRRPMMWNRSMGELRLENGALFKVLSAERPDRIRGWNFAGAWCDELGTWLRPDTFDQLRLALRIGERPRMLVTTTPRPTAAIRGLVERASKSNAVVITRGSTWENKDNLSAAALHELEDRYAGTRLGRQELEGELLEDVEGALWRRSDILRGATAPQLRQIAIGIDPSTWGEDTGGEHSGAGKGIETGMVVVGISMATPVKCYVLEDISARLSPDDWARLAVRRWRHWSKTCETFIVPETNAGGGMVTATIRLVDPAARVFTEKGRAGVHAAKGKRARAEPVAALYQQGRVLHLGQFDILETQMCEWDSSQNWSPDRIDALVWAVTALKPWSAGPGRASGPPSRQPIKVAKPGARSVPGRGALAGRRIGRPRAR